MVHDRTPTEPRYLRNNFSDPCSYEIQRPLRSGPAIQTGLCPTPRAPGRGPETHQGSDSGNVRGLIPRAQRRGPTPGAPLEGTGPDDPNRDLSSSRQSPKVPTRPRRPNVTSHGRWGRTRLKEAVGAQGTKDRSLRCKRVTHDEKRDKVVEGTGVRVEFISGLRVIPPRNWYCVPSGTSRTVHPDLKTTGV